MKFRTHNKKKRGAAERPHLSTHRLPTAQEERT